MNAFLVLLVVTLVAAAYAWTMYRFRLRWWTLILTFGILTLLFIAFFRAESEDRDIIVPQTSEPP